ncbi:MAG: SDR family oxidoreductase [Pirellulales bacterium]|nr:SDR family oxidoreductase [Pirellulales bacterium]
MSSAESARLRENVLVTGASRGIGRALALEFAVRGHDLLLTARNEAELNDLAALIRRTHGVHAHVFPADLVRSEAPQELFDAIAAAGHVVDVLINNAGFGVYGKFAETPASEDRELLAVNVFALTMLTKLFLPGMIARRHGRIVNVASTGAFQPGPWLNTYYASKAYVLSFTEALAEELHGTRVTATALCPGVTVSSFAERSHLEGARILRGPIMSAERVARVGYRGAMRGKRIVIPGLMNRLMRQSVRIAPRGLVTWMVGRMMAKPKRQR